MKNQIKEVQLALKKFIKMVGTDAKNNISVGDLKKLESQISTNLSSNQILAIAIKASIDDVINTLNSKFNKDFAKDGDIKHLYKKWTKVRVKHISGQKYERDIMPLRKAIDHKVGGPRVVLDLKLQLSSAKGKINQINAILKSM